MARFLIVLGLAILVVGLLWPYLSKLGLGRLPGDIVIERENVRFYFPIVAEPTGESGVVGRQPMRGAAPSTIAAGVLEAHRWSVDGRADERWTVAGDYCRYCWMRVVRRPARPCWSIEYCQERNSSTVSVYRQQASSSERSPPRTAATTSALRRMTQRLVPGAGKSAMVSGLPSGPMTYLARGRRGSVINDLTHSTAKSRGR